ncbi:DUF192 domain-containing protein [Patiriisocius hiemis]|uniref:DUF192 domain-containing protein n=1 Tax=Patiriisocius hiemis TaxID=3075604 RepID=A0ABU2YD56_9FLAO|nr:DUF192 domain-containing protein [Constantimarinum sp. W242]MDT0556114.1 DUF192 domain-containing protein [Constantimarinum sp. W242]
MKKVIISAALLGFLFTTGCKKKNTDTKVLTKEVTFTKEGEGTLKKAISDSIVITLDIEIADDEYQTQTGLMYRKSMPDNQGMLFIFNDEVRRSFYMKNTEFALDIIYLNAEKEIVSIQKNAQPFDETSLPSEAPAMYVLEVNAGLSDTWGLEVGDKLEFTRS